MFVPSHCVLVEVAHDHCDVIGLRAGLIVTRDSQGYNAFEEEADDAATPEGALCKLIVKAAKAAVRG